MTKDKVIALIAENRTQAEVAGMLGISRQRVNQILNPLKHTARAAVNLKAELRPPICSCCGKKTKVQGHHEDYSKPLDVLWLCVTCHTDQHHYRECTANLVKPKPNRSMCTECNTLKGSNIHLYKCKKTYLRQP